MRVHPVLLCLEGQPAVAIGGDAAMEPKVRALLDAGAQVTLIAADPSPMLDGLAAGGQLRLLRRDYRTGDMRDATIAYVSSKDPALIAAVRDDARRERVLLNVIDVPEACRFISPAVVRRGDLTIAVGTGGASPALSARLRSRLASEFGTEYGPYINLLGAARRAVWNRPERAALVTALVDSPTLLECVRRGDRAGVDAVLATTLGGEHTLDRLGVTLDGNS